MPLRERMTGALRERRTARQLSLAQVAARAGMARSGVSAIELGTNGAFLDHLEKLARALDARWAVLLVPNEAKDRRGELADLFADMDEGDVGELLRIVQVWQRLSPDDRELVAHLAERQANRPGAEVLPLPGPTARRRAG